MSSKPDLANSLQVGVTGGIGAGKTLVCNIFSVLGIPIYSADERAKWLMSNEPHLVSGIKSAFGENAYTNGELNRRYLAEKVFSDQNQVEKLNQLVHPAVGVDYGLWLSRQSTDYTIKEAALLFESGSYQGLDYVVMVSAPEETRITRVLNRDPQRSEEEVKGIIRKQWPQEKKEELADYVINNDESQMLIPQVLELHHKFSKK